MKVASFEDFVEATFEREGDTYEEPPKIDQPTGRGGITLPELKAYVASKGGTAASVTVATLASLTHEAARDVVRWAHQDSLHRFGLDAIDFEPLQLQMLDFAYNSGAPLAIRWLQRTLNVPVTGSMDVATRGAIAIITQAGYAFLLNQAVCAARFEMIDDWTDDKGHPDRKKWEEGLESRALSFSLIDVTH
jgi:lysozyme family protein